MALCVDYRWTVHEGAWRYAGFLRMQLKRPRYYVFVPAANRASADGSALA